MRTTKAHEPESIGLVGFFRFGMGAPVRSFRDQVVCITGAANGIGRRLSELFVGEGAKVAALDVQPDSLAQRARELGGGNFAWRAADVTDVISLRVAVHELERELGPIDVLVANAGIGKATPADDFRSEDFAPQIAVNLIGVANSIDAVLPGMRERRRGHLVAMSSLASLLGVPHMAGYCAGKAGVTSMMDALRCELKRFNVAVTIICPGWIRTNLTKNVEVPHLNLMDLEPAAQRIMKAIRARKRYVTFPQSTLWQLRFLQCLPRGWRDVLLRLRFRRLLGK